jgi:hypothetical protein
VSKLAKDSSLARMVQLVAEVFAPIEI